MRSEDGVSLCSSQGTLGEASLLLNHLSDGFRAEGSSEGDQGQKKYRNNKSSHKQQNINQVNSNSIYISSLVYDQKYFVLSFFQFQKGCGYIYFLQLMASRYIQKYPIPNDFPLILKNFSREILRDQPTNIIEYAAKYFQALESGQPFKYESIYNVPKEDKKYELNYAPVKADEMVKKELRINHISGAISKKQMQKITRVVDSIFLKYDVDKSGSLELKQLGEMLKVLYKEGYIDVMPTDGQIRQFSTLIDSNHNGKISKGQLSIFIRKLLS